MFKYTDLRVDNKNKRSNLGSFMQFFPNSYLPLLMMYLGRENLMEIKENVADSDPHTIITITPDDINIFYEGSEHIRPFSEIWAEHEAKLKDSIDDDEKIEVAQEALSILPFYRLMDYQNKKGLDNIGLCLKKEINPILINIANIFRIPEEQIEKGSKAYLFSLLWEIEWDAFLSFQYEEKEDEFKTEAWLTAFEDALSKIQAYSRDKIWMQPEELTKVVLSKKVPGGLFNPFAGLASYSVNTVFDDDDIYTKEFALHNNYSGQEIDMVSWAVGKIRLMAYRTDSDHYVISDSRLWTDKFFPNIISTPPFGIKIMNEEGIMEYADQYVLRRSIDTMNGVAMTACVVPASFLTRKDTYELRTRLVKERLLDTIVLLPEGLFLPYTNIKTAIVFLKNEGNKTVKFVDASKYYTVNGRERKLAKNTVKRLILQNDFPDYLYHADELKVQEMRNEFLSSISICRFEEILDKDYSLNVNLYIQHSKYANEGYEDLFLDQIFFPICEDKEKLLKKTKPEKHLEKGHFVSIDDLSSNPLLPYIDFTSLARVQFSESLEAIQGPAMLFSLHGEFRVSLLQENQMVFVPKEDIAAFGYDPKEFYGEYLINELFKSSVREFMADTEMEEIRTAEDIGLLNILSPIPDPNDWRRDRVSAQKDALIQERTHRIRTLEQQLSEIKDKKNDEYIRSLRQRKHRIQQVMDQLCPAFSLLDKYLIEKEVLHNNDIIGRRTGKTVSDYFLLIGDAINKVENMIDHIVDENEWGKTESFKLCGFLNDMSKRNLSDRYTIKVNYNVIDGFGKDAIIVSLNRDRFATVFENIFANAQRWGFVDEHRNDYCIRIDVDKPSFNSVRIRVANNGEPIHPSLDRSRLFEWGIGNHTGYGTWQIKNIVEHYLGTIELHEYPEDKAGFQTEYVIVLPAYV